MIHKNQKTKSEKYYIFHITIIKSPKHFNQVVMEQKSENTVKNETLICK